MTKIIILIVIIKTLLFSDALKVINIAEKATFKIKNIGIGTGTGFLINNQGYVITNNHVTKGYTPTKLIILNKYNKYTNIRMIKTYPKKDISILKIENYSDEEFLRLQDPALIKKGHKSFSLGYPGGSNVLGDRESLLDSTIKSGDVSKILTNSLENRIFPIGYKFIETSSHINGGNSGGPLLSNIGTVIGINTLKSNDQFALGTGGNIIQGIFWAIHVEELIKVLKENNIEYTLSTDDISDINTTDIQENISDVKANSQILTIAISIIIAILLLIIYFIKRNSTNSVKSEEISQLIRNKMKKYKSRDDVLLTPSSPQANYVPKEKTRAILKVLEPENSILPIINLESKKSIIVGRSNESDITINNSEISKKHLRITLVGALIEIEDLDSANGSYIDGKKLDIHKKFILKENEQLIIANEDTIYKIKSVKSKVKSISTIKLVPEDSSLPIINIIGTVTVGRSQNSNIIINNNEVSRSHLEVKIRNNKVQVMDLGSGNGTYINGIEILEGHNEYLLPKDQLIIGSEDVIYKIG